MRNTAASNPGGAMFIAAPTSMPPAEPPSMAILPADVNFSATCGERDRREEGQRSGVSWVDERCSAGEREQGARPGAPASDSKAFMGIGAAPSLHPAAINRSNGRVSGEAP